MYYKSVKLPDFEAFETIFNILGVHCLSETLVKAVHSAKEHSYWERIYGVYGELFARDVLECHTLAHERDLSFTAKLISMISPDLEEAIMKTNKLISPLGAVTILTLCCYLACYKNQNSSNHDIENIDSIKNLFSFLCEEIPNTLSEEQRKAFGSDEGLNYAKILLAFHFQYQGLGPAMRRLKEKMPEQLEKLARLAKLVANVDPTSQLHITSTPNQI